MSKNIDIGKLSIEIEIETCEFQNSINEIVDKIDEIIEKIDELIGSLEDMELNIDRTLSNAYNNNLGAVVNFTTVISAIFTGLALVVAVFGASVAVAVLAVIGVVTLFIAKWYLVLKYWNDIVAWAKNAGQQIGEWASNLGIMISEFFTTQWTNIVTFFTNLPVMIGILLGLLLAKCVEFGANLQGWSDEKIAAVKESIIGYFGELPASIALKFTEIIEGLSTWINETALPFIDENFPFITEGIMAVFNALPEDIVQTGIDLITGLWNGIDSMTSWLGEKITGFAQGVIQGFKDGFDEHSPSKKMIEIGDYLGQGLGIGMDKSFDSVLGKSKKWSSALMGEFGGMKVSVGGNNQIANIGNATRMASGAVKSSLIEKHVRGNTYNTNDNRQSFSSTISVQGGMSTLEYRREANRILRQQAALVARG